MKIVQLITGSSSFGGAEAHVRDLAIGLSSRGHECVVMVGPPHGLLTGQLRSRGISVIEIPALRKPIHPLWDPLSLVQVIAALRKLRPDVIATHTSKAGFIGRIAAALLGIPSFFTPHGLSFIHRETGKPIRFRLSLERLALPLGAGIIAVCDAERRLALDMLPIPPHTIATIHNGLPDRTPSPRKQQSPIVITMVARFDLQKDHATLFKALSTITDLDWELRLAGSGPLLPAAKRLADQYGLTPRTRFLDECSDVPSLLSASDIFVLISNWEAFPISILEAMREGLPVLATDIGGVNEAINHGVNGFLVPRKDANRVAQYLASLLRSADLRQSMGAQSRQSFCKKFVSHRMLDKTVTVYTAALPNLNSTTDPDQVGIAPSTNSTRPKTLDTLLSQERYAIQSHPGNKP